MFVLFSFCWLAPELGRLAFQPPDGLLKVGDDVRILCFRTDVNDSSSTPDGEFDLVDVRGRSDLLSMNVTFMPVHVQPPVGHATYPLYGSTVILCSYEDSLGRRIEKNLTVRILRELTHFLFHCYSGPECCGCFAATYVNWC